MNPPDKADTWTAFAKGTARHPPPTRKEHHGIRETIAVPMNAHPRFNCQTLSSVRLHEWIEKDLAIFCVADDHPPMGHKGVACMWQGTRFILYESDLPKA